MKEHIILFSSILYVLPCIYYWQKIQVDTTVCRVSVCVCKCVSVSVCLCLKKPGNIPLVMTNLDSGTGSTSPLPLTVFLP